MNTQCRRTGSTASKAGSPSFTSSDDHWTKEYHQGPSFDQDIAIPALAVTDGGPIMGGDSDVGRSLSKLVKRPIFEI